LKDYDRDHVHSTPAYEPKVNPYLRFNHESIIAFLLDAQVFLGHSGKSRNPLVPNHFLESGFPLRCARNDGPFIVPNDKNLNIEF
jgi:hypothetical protein